MFQFKILQFQKSVQRSLESCHSCKSVQGFKNLRAGVQNNVQRFKKDWSGFKKMFTHSKSYVVQQNVDGSKNMLMDSKNLGLEKTFTRDRKFLLQVKNITSWFDLHA